MKLGILKNEFDTGHLNWSEACTHLGLDYEVIDLTSDNWLTNISSSNLDGFLACPPGREQLYKILYDERIDIIERTLNRFVYPNLTEIKLHENKKFLSYWLAANRIPHPITHVFYSEEEAKNYLKNSTYPIVAKMNIGASGKGVHLLKTKEDALNYIKSGFSKGIRQAWGPNLKMGNYRGRLTKLYQNPRRILNRLEVYKKNYLELQKGYIIFQQYVPHTFEWRIVKIGNSFFGHQKVKQGDKASGTKGINYICPPDDLLEFVAELCAKYNFNSMAVDLFEDGMGGYLINELQCIFGHVQSYICEKNGKPGRLIKRNQSWHFEEGMFNTNLSYNLRLENVVDILKIRKLI